MSKGFGTRRVKVKHSQPSNKVPLPTRPIVPEVRIINILAAVTKSKARVQGETQKMRNLVDQARAAGCTWVQIGAALGVTPEAASATYRARHQPPPRKRRGRPPKVKVPEVLSDAEQPSLPL